MLSGTPGFARADAGESGLASVFLSFFKAAGGKPGRLELLRTERTAGGAFLYRFSRFLFAAGLELLPVCGSSSSSSLSGLGYTLDMLLRSGIYDMSYFWRPSLEALACIRRWET